MSLPCYLHDEANFQTAVLVGTAEGIHYIELLAREFLYSKVLEHCPSSLCNGLVVVLVFIRSPPYSILAYLVHYKELVFG